MKALECDVADALQNDDRTVLQKLAQSCREFRAFVVAKIEAQSVYEKDRTKQEFVNTEKMSELQKEIDTVKTNIDDTILQRKVVSKKIANVIKLQESLQKGLGEAKAQKETLSLDIMDIQLELEERRRKKILQWDAIKRACNVYKTHLDMHIGFEEEENRIKVSFFTHNKATRDKYFVQLSHGKNGWTVEQVEPKLSKEHLNELSNISEFPEQLKVPDIILFLCQVRNIYLKHHMKAREKL